MLELGSRQVQRQTMVPALVQSLRCLQLPWVELKQELQHLWESNPYVDLVVPKEEINFMADGTASTEKRTRWEENLVGHESLEDYLLHQVPELDAKEKEIFSFLVAQLDERGYLRESMEVLSQQGSWNIEALESVWHILRSLEPKGIGAKDLIDCWLMQIPEAQMFLRQFLILNGEDLLKRRYDRIVKRMHWDRQQLTQILHYLRGLTAVPLKNWQEDESLICVPDFYFFQDAVGNWDVRLASDSYALRWGDAYKDWLAQPKQHKASDKDDLVYFRSQRQLAQQWMQALSLRAASMRRIGEYILKKQRLFFDEEEHPLLPLLQKDAAEELELNPATLSRALQGKYASMPWKIWPLSHFFPRAWGKDRVKIALPQIRQKICEWVAAEDKDHPLSDEELARKLQREMQWPIPRRTVEKYRKQWGIASSRDRKYGL
jgi:RNA polymerase sigma-54 factor